MLAMAFAGILGASAYMGDVSNGLGTTIMFTGLVAGLKKDEKWETLDDSTKAFAQQLDKSISDVQAGILSKEDVLTEIKSYLEENAPGMPQADKEKLEELQESVKNLALKLDKQNHQVDHATAKTLKARIQKALEDNKEKLEEAANKRDGGFNISLKANDSVLTTAYSSSAPNSYLPVPNFIPGYNTSPEVEVNIMDVIDMGTSDSPTITWVNEQPIEGDAGWTAENELKSQVAWKYENETSTAKKVTAFIKVTTQALRNIPWLTNRIYSRLMELVQRKIQDGIINGDGTNDSLNGIINQVSSYTTDSFDDSVDNPTTGDALSAMAGQIEELEYDTANLVAVMNGVDIRKMGWEKDENGQYMVPNFHTPNGTFVHNMRVVKNNKIPKGYAIVGDLKKFTVLMVENLMLDIGLDGSDFTFNRRTILCEAELISMISENDLGCIVYGNIAAVKAEIDKAV